MYGQYIVQRSNPHLIPFCIAQVVQLSSSGCTTGDPPWARGPGVEPINEVYPIDGSLGDLNQTAVAGCMSIVYPVEVVHVVIAA